MHCQALPSARRVGALQPAAEANGSDEVVDLTPFVRRGRNVPECD
jgi:hypothetical protein